MRTLLSALLTSAFLLLPQAPADAGFDRAPARDGGPEVRVAATRECSAPQQFAVILFIRNTGPQELHIEPPVRGGLRVPPGEHLRFFGRPAPGFDVIAPGGQVRFVIPFETDQPDLFDAERVTFWVDVRFAELPHPVIRHIALPGCP